MAKTVELPSGSPAGMNDPSRGVGPRRRLSVSAALLTVVFGGVAVPALGDTAAATGPGGGCWALGATPGLFDWTAAPGIACRDGAASAPSVPPPAQPTASALANGQAPRGPGAPPQVTFSGSAYAGIAVAF